MSERIGFISTRFAGTDGVSLEAAKWAEVLQEQGHVCFWYGGLLERWRKFSMCVPEAYFKHPANEWINEHIWGRTHRSPKVTRYIHDLAEYLKSTIYDFVKEFDLTLLIIQNALAIPMHLPLGIAITEFLSETVMPAIAHHHDFYWERSRFQVNCVPDFLDMAFPPRDFHLQHVVINQAAREELALRKGVSSLLIPNVINFHRPPLPPDEYSADLRQEIGLSSDDKLILQPTRVVPRKGIEHSINLLQRLNDPRCKLVVSHPAGDEGSEYQEQLMALAESVGVDIRFFGERVNYRRHVNCQGKKIYVLHDIYQHADLVIYPSIYEGFGNALLESFYFKVPVIVNRYPVWVRDIEPKGFRVPVMDGFITPHVVEEAKKLLYNHEYRQQQVDYNYELAKRYYSYPVLRYGLQILINNIKNQV
ncbi:glycosyltransferase family 4 protein [Desulfohalobiaceae bacterium Ax17]|uniref:glycosyltransferase family 4 protein n=1 Tax=Desulfovulcanus ferrireducens TaxID=2831190 RepID=UPI00207BAC8F|nr:glycosyltransferase family 4 protein [Desulfovulcanus ferrireducens]MBT8763992.1 glycosyltransferase family 4 protein [Desulfovulcanus ferrireducens]